jgi:hypothetical protein
MTKYLNGTCRARTPRFIEAVVTLQHQSAAEPARIAEMHCCNGENIISSYIILLEEGQKRYGRVYDVVDLPRIYFVHFARSARRQKAANLCNFQSSVPRSRCITNSFCFFKRFEVGLIFGLFRTDVLESSDFFS